MGVVERGLADTSYFIAHESGRPIDRTGLPVSLGVSIITLGELRSGVLAATNDHDRSARLATFAMAHDLAPLPIDERVAASWADLRRSLAVRGRRMPINDSWIAATAMAYGIPVVTQDDDFDVDVPGLEVVKV